MNPACARNQTPFDLSLRTRGTSKYSVNFSDGITMSEWFIIRRSQSAFRNFDLSLRTRGTSKYSVNFSDGITMSEWFIIRRSQSAFKNALDKPDCRRGGLSNSVDGIHVERNSSFYLERIKPTRIRLVTLYNFRRTLIDPSIFISCFVMNQLNIITVRLFLRIVVTDPPPLIMPSQITEQWQITLSAKKQQILSDSTFQIVKVIILITLPA